MNIDELLQAIPHHEGRIVSAPNPACAHTAIDGRVGLMLCEHMHRGQVNIPFYGAPLLP
ncbi:MAG: hypothetical protein JSW39_04510 [Desulfobacterales bacterium]|nr:MAG: hypothetical protein JSW39_04510 [Desulfobacterales bacterium]